MIRIWRIEKSGEKGVEHEKEGCGDIFAENVVCDLRRGKPSKKDPSKAVYRLDNLFVRQLLTYLKHHGERREIIYTFMDGPPQDEMLELLKIAGFEKMDITSKDERSAKWVWWGRPPGQVSEAIDRIEEWFLDWKRRGVVVEEEKRVTVIFISEEFIQRLMDEVGFRR